MMESQSYDSVTHNLTTEQKEYAAKVLNETDENREKAIAEIKLWIQESDLRARTDDFFILRFLRVCKFNIEKTKTRIQNFQKQRANLPGWYTNRDPLLPKLQEVLDMGVCLPLRKLDNEGRLVILGRLVHNPDKFTLEDVVKIAVMILEMALRNSVEASLCGIVVIADLQYATLRNITQMRPRFLMNIVHMWQGCYPIRIQLFNYINMPEYAKYMVAIMRFFLTSKLKKRFHFYTRKTTPDSFKSMPSDVLPVEYGGTGGTIQELTAHWKKVIEENRDWFIDDEKYTPVL